MIICKPNPLCPNPRLADKTDHGFTRTVPPLLLLQVEFLDFFFFKIEKIIQLELFSSCNLRAPLHPAGRGGSPDIMAENVSAPYSVPLSYISAPTPTPTPGIMREGEAWT